VFEHFKVDQAVIYALLIDLSVLGIGLLASPVSAVLIFSATKMLDSVSYVVYFRRKKFLYSGIDVINTLPLRYSVEKTAHQLCIGYSLQLLSVTESGHLTTLPLFNAPLKETLEKFRIKPKRKKLVSLGCILPFVVRVRLHLHLCAAVCMVHKGRSGSSKFIDFGTIVVSDQ